MKTGRVRLLLSAWILGVLTVVFPLVLMVRAERARRAELIPKNTVRYMEQLNHPDMLGRRMVLLEITMADRPTDPYYASVLLSDWESCYVAPCRVFHPDGKSKPEATWKEQVRDDVVNAVQCVFSQNPEVGFGSVSPRKK